MINPLVFKFGPLEIHAFTGAILLAVALGVALLTIAARLRGESPLRWLDVALGAVVGGVIGARSFHIILEWSYFSAHIDQVLALASGGFDWHGAVIGAVIGTVLIAWLRGVPFRPFSDVIGLALPLGAIAVWWGCSEAASAYGLEVRTLADFPAWLVTETPDVYGQIAPRLNLPQIGMLIGLIAYLFIGSLALLRLARGFRFWIALALLSFSTAILDFFRGDYVILVSGRRADQLLDLALLLIATIGIAVFAMIRGSSVSPRRVTARDRS